MYQRHLYRWRWMGKHFPARTIAVRFAWEGKKMEDCQISFFKAKQCVLPSLCILMLSNSSGGEQHSTIEWAILISRARDAREWAMLGIYLNSTNLKSVKISPWCLCFCRVWLSFLPLRWSKCLPVFDAVIQLKDYARWGISTPILTTESTEPT